ncbi:MAG: NAD(P)-dependent oxidoreductase, partial [Acidobacteriota bacterium]|nr:NAD(P)-dependent oxidoreductase [Acidobacteriota bacterium]
MRVLIFGGSGMLGHKLGQFMAGRAETYLTFRSLSPLHLRHGLFDPAHTLNNVSAENFDSIVRAVARARPVVVVNCV